MNDGRSFMIIPVRSHNQDLGLKNYYDLASFCVQDHYRFWNYMYICD